MGKRRGETPEDEGKQPPKAAERGGEERERAEREEPGTGGLSKATYDAATEKAVKDIHGEARFAWGRLAKGERVSAQPCVARGETRAVAPG